MKCYRCGWCGQPTDENGKALEVKVVKSMGVDWDEAEMVQGICCGHKGEERQIVEVTREMALDAGIPELEGTYMEW